MKLLVISPHVRSLVSRNQEFSWTICRLYKLLSAVQVKQGICMPQRPCNAGAARELTQTMFNEGDNGIVERRMIQYLEAIDGPLEYLM